MNEYVEANKNGWGTLAKDHYETFKARLLANETLLNPTQIKELGDIAGKSRHDNGEGTRSNAQANQHTAG